jgi:hypothetical protein
MQPNMPAARSLREFEKLTVNNIAAHGTLRCRIHIITEDYSPQSFEYYWSQLNHSLVSPHTQPWLNSSYQMKTIVIPFYTLSHNTSLFPPHRSCITPNHQIFQHFQLHQSSPPFSTTNSPSNHEIHTPAPTVSQSCPLLSSPQRAHHSIPTQCSKLSWT